MEWKNVTDFFTEEQKQYNGKYLEINEVYNEVVEVSLFSSRDALYEIYISYGKMYGIIYVEKEKAYDLREKIKKEITKEYKKHKEPIDEFIDKFNKKYKICIPRDIFFNDETMFDLF